MYEETDDEGTDEMTLDKSDEIRRRQKYKFQSVVITVLKTSTSSHCEKVIEWMEVWPQNLNAHGSSNGRTCSTSLPTLRIMQQTQSLLISFTTFLRPG